MEIMAEKKRKPKGPSDSAAEESKKTNAIFITVDEETERKLQTFIDSQRIKPRRAMVALTALTEFLAREVPD